MAKDKKSVLLYCDLIHTVEGLKDAEAGKLFKHFLRYVNDLEPNAPDRLTEIVFEPIKQSLKRDLKKYESKRQKNIDNANMRWQNKNANASDGIKNDANDAVRDRVSVSDSVSDRVIKKETIRENVFLHRKEIEKLESQFLGEDLNWIYDKLSAYKLSNGKKYKSDYGAIISWVIDRLKEEKLKEKNSAKKENNGQQNNGESRLNALTNW